MKLSANKNLEQVCVVGDGLPQPIALVILSEKGKNNDKEQLLLSLNKTLKIVNAKFNPHERIHNIIILNQPWTVENQLLTPTMKIKRNKIEKLYKENYHQWYDDEKINIID